MKVNINEWPFATSWPWPLNIAASSDKVAKEEKAGKQKGIKGKQRKTRNTVPSKQCGLASNPTNRILYCTVPYSIVLYLNILYCTLLYCTVTYCTLMYSTVLYNTVLYCTLL